jgi:hypothetical protein
MTEHPREDLAAFAVGALDASDARRVGSHVDQCSACRADAEAFGEVAWAIADASARTPPAALRERVLAVSRDAGQAQSWIARLAEVVRRPVPLAIPVALALLLVVSVAGLRAARSDADSYAAAIAGVAGGRVVSLAPTGGFDAHGALVVPASGAPYLLLQVPPPPSGKTWEAWVVRGENPLPAGITGERSGVITLVLTQSVSPGDAIVVTVEDAGGTTSPKGPAVLQVKT